MPFSNFPQELYDSNGFYVISEEYQELSWLIKTAGLTPLDIGTNFESISPDLPSEKSSDTNVSLTTYSTETTPPHSNFAYTNDFTMVDPTTELSISLPTSPLASPLSLPSSPIDNTTLTILAHASFKKRAHKTNSFKGKFSFLIKLLGLKKEWAQFRKQYPCSTSQPCIKR